jgi:hypothetical protein
MLNSISIRWLSLCAAGVVTNAQAAPTPLPGLNDATNAVTAQYVYDNDLGFKVLLGGPSVDDITDIAQPHTSASMTGGPFVVPLPANDNILNWSVVFNTVTMEDIGSDSVTITGSVQHVLSNVPNHVHGAGPTANFTAVLNGGSDETLVVNPGNVSFDSGDDADPWTVLNEHDGHWDHLTFKLTEISPLGSNIDSWSLEIVGVHNGVPAPGVMGMLGFGGMAMARRRR